MLYRSMTPLPVMLIYDTTTCYAITTCYVGTSILSNFVNTDASNPAHYTYYYYSFYSPFLCLLLFRHGA